MSLFTTHIETPRVAPVPKPGGFVPRDYQAEDIDAVRAAWANGNRHVLCVWATGMGKSHGAAQLVCGKPAGTRAIVVVDSTNLAMDLYRTIMRHQGSPPGILTGDLKADWGEKEIVVATKQSLCAGKTQRYELLPIEDFSVAVIDECEAALA